MAKRARSDSLALSSVSSVSLLPRIFEELPLEILLHVFSFLPIKVAAQNCTQGSKFRNCKQFNRKFIFGRELAMRRNRESVAKLVDHLFDTHKGDLIDSFQLHIDPVEIEELLDKWLRICVEKKIQDLELYFLRPGYTLTEDFLNQLKNLSSLKLVHCEFELPLKLQSLTNLRSLILWHVPLTNERLQTLIVRCRMLQTIDLLHCAELSRVEIYAAEHRYFKMLRIAGCNNLSMVEVVSPTLRCVHYCGHVPSTITFQAPQLSEALFNFVPAGNRRYLRASVLEKLVCDISNVTVLSASVLIPEALTAKIHHGVFGEICYNFLNLRELHLIMNGGLFCNPYDIIMLMKRCPILEKLFIDIDDYNFECGPYWELHQKPKLDKLDHYFDRLKYIKLKGFKFLQSELQLVKILLSKATHLEALILVTPKNGRIKLWRADGPKYSHLFDSWKASPEVKIVLFEHTADRSLVRPSHSKDWLL
ncbi:hypothetical protein GYH30_037267 [Glycine max]|nr:hypothetical protein GYH30_037267 [Glycine max]